MADDGDDEWRFAVEDVGDDEADAPATGTGTDGDGDGNADGESDAWGVTVGDETDGPSVTVGGPERAAEELEAETDGNVAGTLAPDTPVEPGTPDLENAVFVGIGALLTILVFVSLVESDPAVLGGVTVGVIAGIAALYAFFTRF